MKYSSKLVVIIIFIIAISHVLVSCADSGKQEKARFAYNKITRGDKIRLNLTVTMDKDKYLSGPSPVIVKIPGNCIVKFENQEYRISRPIFPMSMIFEVPAATKPGKHTVDLGLVLTYCNKSDDTCQIRNEVLRVPLDVSDELRPTSTAYHNINTEYHVQ